VIVQHFEIQLIRPPVSILCAFGLSSTKDTSAEGTAAEWAFAFAHNRLRCSYGYDSWTGSKTLPLADVLGGLPLLSLFVYWGSALPSLILLGSARQFAQCPQ
jgi:hypothetical protein